jgi:F0F1-type ATP synthase membrane subunit b/b'
MKKIAVALIMLPLCCVGCGKSHDSGEARVKPNFDSGSRQVREEVVKEERVAGDRVDVERIQADIARTAEKARTDVLEIKADAQRAGAEVVHNATEEAKRDVDEIKSDVKKSAKKLIDDFFE